jgi:ribokinase
LKVLSPILNRAHLLFVNQREIRHLTGEDVITGAKSCLKQGCHTVVVTLGKGMRLELGGRAVTAVGYIKDAENEYAIEPSSQDIVSEVDATGAGDAFAAGFLYGLLKGKGLNECGRLGDIVARFSLTKLGAREGLPTFTELAQRYRELYNQPL